MSSSSSSSIVVVFSFLDAGISSSSSPASALVRFDPTLLGCLVVLDAGLGFGAVLVFVLDAGFEDVAPSVVEFEFAAAAFA